MIVVHVYCPMSLIRRRRVHHYHFAVETPRENLSRSIGWFQATCSIRFNRRFPVGISLIRLRPVGAEATWITSST